MLPILGRTWLEWIRLSRIFRAPFANLSLEIVKKMSRYYLLSGLSRIFRKPFANVYISRKVPFAQTSQIYACGPRLYKTFHGFLHDSHIYIWLYLCVCVILVCLYIRCLNTSSLEMMKKPYSTSNYVMITKLSRCYQILQYLSYSFLESHITDFSMSILMSHHILNYLKYSDSGQSYNKAL